MLKDAESTTIQSDNKSIGDKGKARSEITVFKLMSTFKTLKKIENAKIES